jgi:Ca2+-binding RTX toxin-like protein
VTPAGAATIQGGVDSADGADSLFGTATGNDLIFGNGGADTISTEDGLNTAVGGMGGDSVLAGFADDRIFGNEGNDVINANSGADSVVGGQGNDNIGAMDGTDNVNGNEGNDTIFGGAQADTLTGGSGNDTFLYLSPFDDGNGAAGGAIDMVTDLNWAEDNLALQAGPAVDFARNYGSAFTGQGTLASAAQTAVSTAFAEAASAGCNVAAQFTFGGRTYLVADVNNVGSFTDTDDLLIDITGATGTISTTRLL